MVDSRTCRSILGEPGGAGCGSKYVARLFMGKGEAASRRELMELHGDAVEVDI